MSAKSYRVRRLAPLNWAVTYEYTSSADKYCAFVLQWGYWTRGGAERARRKRIVVDGWGGESD